MAGDSLSLSCHFDGEICCDKKITVFGRLCVSEYVHICRKQEQAKRKKSIKIYVTTTIKTKKSKKKNAIEMQKKKNDLLSPAILEWNATLAGACKCHFIMRHGFKEIEIFKTIKKQNHNKIIKKKKQIFQKVIPYFAKNIFFCFLSCQLNQYTICFP